MPAVKASVFKSSAIKSSAAKPTTAGSQARKRPHTDNTGPEDGAAAALEQMTRPPFFADQALISLALEAGQIAVWSWDIRSKRVEWSSNIEEVCGVAPESASATETILENEIHPEDRPAV